MTEVMTVLVASSKPTVGLSILSARRRVRVVELGLYPATGRTPLSGSRFPGRDLFKQ